MTIISINLYDFDVAPKVGVFFCEQLITLFQGINFGPVYQYWSSFACIVIRMR